MKIRLVVCYALVLFWSPLGLSEEPKFERQTIDGNIQIGYGLSLGHVDGDKKVDILLADKKDIVWYQNPGKAGETWPKYVIARNLTPRDNVCLAARDIDGDGLVEVAVGADWNPVETTDAGVSGALFYLKRPSDPTKPWNPVPIQPHQPTTHRMHWLKNAEGKFLLAVLPLHGVGNKSGEGKNVFVSLFDVSSDKPVLSNRVDTTMHMTHNFEIITDPGFGEQEVMLVAGKEGYAVVLSSGGDAMQVVDTSQSKGAGEVRRYPIPERVFVGIEPMHGSDVVVYRSAGDGKWDKAILDRTLAQGHAIAAGNLFGSDAPEVVAGWRNPNQDGKVGIRIYEPADGKWTMHVLDDDHTACEDLKLVDLNGDGKLDVLGAGRRTKNVVVYWNQSS